MALTDEYGGNTLMINKHSKKPREIKFSANNLSQYSIINTKCYILFGCLLDFLKIFFLRKFNNSQFLEFLISVSLPYPQIHHRSKNDSHCINYISIIFNHSNCIFMAIQSPLLKFERWTLGLIGNFFLFDIDSQF